MEYSQSRAGMVSAAGNTQSQASLVANPELQQKVAPLLTEMVRYLLKKKPQDPVPHILQFLKDKAGQGEPEITTEERVELEQLRSMYKQMREKLEKAGDAVPGSGSDGAAAKKKKAKDDDSSSDSEVSCFPTHL